ncbi:MAG: hypothetical protein KAH91_01165 [Thermoplasmatales archaeon]|nr:hypothetical protein [Thermoplasmatales archaeon]
MRKVIIYLVVCITVAATLFAMASEENVDTIEHEITITTQTEFLLVNEVLTIQGETNASYDTLTVWVQSDANNVDILVNSNTPTSITENGSEYTCNISSLGITEEDSTQVKITYELDKNVEFTKKVVRSTNSISVTFDQEEIYTATNQASGITFNLKLYKPTEQTLNWFYTVLILLLLVLVGVLVAYAFRKQKTTKIKKTAGESEELLNTKKALLMELLKDIEKQHRAKQISDDTYHKLKERYKQETVETMKQLEDINSKVK